MLIISKIALQIVLIDLYIIIIGLMIIHINRIIEMFKIKSWYHFTQWIINVSLELILFILICFENGLIWC